MKYKNYTPALYLSIFYLVVAYITKLDWGLFRDEHLYISATKDFVNALPDIKFTLNFSSFGIIIWGWLWKIFDFNIQILRFSIICTIILSNFACIKIADKLGFEKPWHSMLLIAFLPEIYTYSFQMNGMALNIFLSMVIILLFLRSHLTLKENNIIELRMNSLLILLCTLAAIMNNPFLLAYPVAIIVFEGMNLLKENNMDKKKSRILMISMSSLSIFLWCIFIVFVSDANANATLESMKFGNPKFLFFYFGNIFLFFCYLGGMFPFLPFVFTKRLRMRVIMPIIIVGILLAFQCIPLNRYAYGPGFHTVVTMGFDRFVNYFQLSPMLMNIFYLILVGLGLYNFCHIIYLSKKDIYYNFILVVIFLFMSLMLLDGYIASRLYLPGILGLFILITKIYEGKPSAYYLQILYQIFLMITYSITLHIKYGFLS